MNKLHKFKQLTTLIVTLSIGFFLFGLSLFLFQGMALAAPPELPITPQQFIVQNSLTITGTKTSIPALTVEAGGLLTYTIVFSSDVIGTVVVTDAIPDLTDYVSGTISGTALTSTNSIISDDSSLPLLSWTVDNQVTHSPITLTFTVLVTNSIGTDSLITNTAWLSQANNIYSHTHTVTATATSAISQVIYLSKTSTPAVTVEAGGLLTYSVVFSSNTVGTVVVTDAIPDLTDYMAGTISSTALTSTNTIVPDDSSLPILSWTVDNQVTHSPITLTFTVLVTNSIGTDSLITNTAWLSQASNIYSRTHIVTAVAPQSVSQTVYLPIALKNYRCSQDSYEPNDDRTIKAEAQEWTFGSGITINGNFCIDFSDPSDYFWLELTGGGTLNITLIPPSTADYDLYLYKGEGASSSLTSSRNAGLGVPENLSYSIPAGTDTYFIRVYPFNKGTGDTYILTVTY